MRTLSYETTVAKARAAEHEWKWHKMGCPPCSANRVRREDMCDAGLELYDDHRAAQTELAENRRLDKLPSPGQGTLL